MKYLDDNKIEELDEFITVLEKYCESSNNLSLTMLPSKFRTIVEMKKENKGGQNFVNSIHDFSNLVMSIESEEYVFELITMLSTSTTK
jgi:hypothetical protein